VTGTSTRIDSTVNYARVSQRRSRANAGHNEAFTGRDRMLVELREGLQGSGRSGGPRPARRGWGGVGKTQLAAEYAWRFAGDYDAGWWVNAEQADRIGEQYAAFAAACGLVDPTTPVGPAVDALRAYCRGRGGWLVVLDNASTARDLHPWRLPGPGHVLVTSRDPYWPEIAATVEVDVFSRAESAALLRAHLPALPDCLAPDSMETIKPGGTTNDGSTAEVPR